jgi:hypothetical protein
MAQLEIVKSIQIKASADAVWKILSDDYASVGSWATAVDASRPNPDAGEPLAGAPVAGRVCAAPGFGDIHEKIVDYDASLRTLTYEATASKIPSFVTDMLNRWDITPAGPNECVAKSTLSANAGGVMGAMMAPMMKRKFASTIDTTMTDLKSFAETGSPSGAKRHALAKAA